ncbi:phage tail protein I [Bacillus sp. ISL-57]|uniref:phage tail protein I n=1 Tax=Bacillus sp. ISL-57 TaxID=2819135 RepID=UPI001BEA5D68|nr:phage tail protein I [Bacillus sp. ISL-57]MBT2717561.1 phage tail protein I [Bacillus sp. ISL-57]
MIKTLNNFELRDFIPPSLKKDTEIVAMADALTPIFQMIYEKTKLIKQFEGIPDNLLDFIAYEEIVDFYETTMSVEEKRALIDRAQIVHQLKGTPAAIEEVAGIFFKNARVREWFEYGGDPYYFRIETDETFKSEVDIARLFRLIETTKRKSSRLEGVLFKGDGGFQIQAVRNEEENNNIHLQLICGVAVAGKWPTISTLGRIVEREVQVKSSPIEKSSSTYPFTAAIYAGETMPFSKTPPNDFTSYFGGSLDTSQEVIKVSSSYPVISESLMPQQLLTGYEKKYEQEGRYYDQNIEASSQFTALTKWNYICGTFVAGKGVNS